MKHFIKYFLQKILGYNNYLYRFAKYKIKRLRNDKKERDFFAFIEAIDKPGVILDVGANLGIMTWHLSKKFPDRKIVAIEPIPSNFEVLTRIVSEDKLGNVQLLNLAVGDKSGEIEMVLPEEGSVKEQGLAHVVHESIGERNIGEKYRMQCKTLDEITAGEKVAGIKMDIENYECFALVGAREILKNSQPVLYLELWDNDNRKNCFELLEKIGYRVFVNNAGVLKLFDPKKHRQQNFVCW